ncbi:MAG: 4Fe-4S dicluster domain-containing protein [Myxococcales bacterium]|nr:4Fe-4S dicluster domain-containing protein [Myxococcales bacterium]
MSEAPQLYLEQSQDNLIGETDPKVAIRQMPLFEGLTASEVDKIASISEIVHRPQDRIVARAEPADAAYCFVLRGQVAFAEFAKGKVPEEPKNLKKRITPVMELCERVVAIFDVGDVFKNDHVATSTEESSVEYDMALFTCVNIVLLQVKQKDLDAALKGLSRIKERIDSLSEVSFYRQTLLKVDGRSDILDFYVKNGFEYAGAIKVIQTDKCIDCDECIKACEDRHGISRIERFGPRVGLLQFTRNCRSCLDARCIEVCNFEAIGYDSRVPEREVVVYDNCVGCMKCSKACPHDAIQMVEVEEPEDLDLVGLVEGQKDRPATRIAKGEEAPPVAKKKKKPKRIANKCDHCFGYSDMACISACPTAAIIQIDPRALFRRDGGLIERSDRYFEQAPFEQGWSQTTRTQGVRLMHGTFGLATLGVLFAIVEYTLRVVAPEWSLYRGLIALTQSDKMAADLDLSMSPVFGFLRWLGYLGGGMMVVSAMYTVRLNVPLLRRMGGARTWFDLHVVFGLAGPILGLLHTNFAITDIAARPMVVSLWWMVFAIVLSGLLGRFFYTAIPRLEAAAERARTELDRGIKSVADEWSSMTVSVNVLAQFMKAQEKTGPAAAKLEELSAGRALIELLKNEYQHIRSRRALRKSTIGKIKNDELRNTTLQLVRQRADVDRRVALYSVTKRMLGWWRSIHIAVTVFMFVLLIFHVAISLYATGLGV